MSIKRLQRVLEELRVHEDEAYDLELTDNTYGFLSGLNVAIEALEEQIELAKRARERRADWLSVQQLCELPSVN